MELYVMATLSRLPSKKKDEDLKVEELVWICVRLELPLRLSFIVLLVMVRILDISI